MDDLTKQRKITRFPEQKSRDDLVALEEPIEIKVNGESIAVLMRTPSRDRELVAGFLLTEGIVDGTDDIKALSPCVDPSRPNANNIFLVTLASGCQHPNSRVEKARRNFYATSSCGLCGKATIENIHQMVSPHDDFVSLPHHLVQRMGKDAEKHQIAFGKTGGIHAAAVFSIEGECELLVLGEDIGRHNAVDKVIGELFLEKRLPLHSHALWVSGRASFEVVQKALMAGITALVCVGAPSSLAIELAEESRMTLIGFAQGGDRFNLYTGSVH